MSARRMMDSEVDMTAPVALQLYSLRETMVKDWQATVRSVAEMGYVGVEPAGFPGTTAEEAGKLFKELGLQVPSAHLPLPVGDQKNASLEAALAIGAPYVISGKGPVDFESVDAIKATCDLFNEASENARAAGLLFGVHNHWWEYLKVDGKYAYEYMLDLLDPTITFEIDTYWVKTAGADPVKVVAQMGERSPLLHIKDGPCVQKDPMTAVGDGVMDFGPIVEAGKPYTQWLIVEIDRCATDMAEAVAKSVKYLHTSGLGRANL